MPSLAQTAGTVPQITSTSQGQLEWTGRWLIRDEITGQVLHQVSGIGNVQADANQFAQRWMQQTRYSQPVEIVPEYR
jgi:hypothetical protein